MQEISLEPVPERRPRNDRRRARNRENLIVAALHLAAEQGAGALTPVAIARRAGLHKQAFYVHFKSLDECVAAVAQRLTAEHRNGPELRQAELVRQPVRDRAAELREMRGQLAFVREHAAIFRLLANARFAEGPVAEVVREIVKQSRRLWTSVLLELAVRNGIRPSALAEIEDLAEAMIEMNMATSVRVINDPALSLEAEAERHLRYTDHLVRRELQYIYRQQQRAAQ